MTAPSCPWKIRFGTTEEYTVQCNRVEDAVAGVEHGDGEHRGMFRNDAVPVGYTTITWYAGDRREYTGDWPGACGYSVLSGQAQWCVLPLGHPGRCAP